MTCNCNKCCSALNNFWKEGNYKAATSSAEGFEVSTGTPPSNIYTTAATIFTPSNYPALTQ